MDLSLADRMNLGKRLARAVFGQPEPPVVSMTIANLAEHPDATEGVLALSLEDAYRAAKILSRPPCPHAVAAILPRFAMERVIRIDIDRRFEESVPEKATVEVAKAVYDVAEAINDALADPVAATEAVEPPPASDLLGTTEPPPPPAGDAKRTRRVREKLY